MVFGLFSGGQNTVSVSWVLLRLSSLICELLWCMCDGSLKTSSSAFLARGCPDMLKTSSWCVVLANLLFPCWFSYQLFQPLPGETRQHLGLCLWASVSLFSDLLDFCFICFYLWGAGSIDIEYFCAFLFGVIIIINLCFSAGTAVYYTLRSMFCNRVALEIFIHLFHFLIADLYNSSMSFLLMVFQNSFITFSLFMQHFFTILLEPAC